MAFVPRTAEEILNDFVNYLAINTKLTDFNVGSVIRTLLEVVALEDATQYNQMINVLNTFFIESATGDGLEDRAAQYGLTRKQATSSSGTVFFLDTSLEKAFLIQDLSGGISTSISVDDASVFPTPAPTITVRLGEGSGSQEDVTVNAIDTTTNILTLAAPVVFNHTAAASLVDTIDNRANLVCFVSGLPARTVPSGVTLSSVSTNINISVSAYTSAPSSFPNGNFASDSVSVTTKNFGTASIIPPKMLNDIVGASPFFGATVINTSAISGGANLESDNLLRTRIIEHIGGLSAGTLSAVSSAILNSGETEAERIIKVNIFENFEDKTVFAYVSTGSDSFIGTKNLAITDTLSANIPFALPVLAVPVNNITDFPEATLGNLQWAVIDPGNANAQLKVFQYSQKNITPNNVISAFDLASGLGMPNGFPIIAGTNIVIPEVVSENTEFNKKYYTLLTFPLTDDQLMLHLVSYNNATLTVDGDSTIQLLQQGIHYLLNESVSQIEFLEGNIPPAGSALLATYNTYAGVVKSAQLAIDGSIVDPINFPGVRSAGVKIRVIPALKEIVDFVIDVTYESDLTNIETLQFLADQAVRSYVVTLPIGGDIILAEIIDRLMDVVGVTNVRIASPSDDVSILHDHYAAIGIVTVS